MANKDFIPATDNDFLAWLDHLAAMAEARQAELGLPAATLQAVKDAAAGFRARMQTMTLAKATYDHAVQEKKAGRKDAEAASRTLARQAKASSAYTDALGKLLQIIGSGDSTDYAAIKPDLTGKDLGGGKVELDFSKKNTDGVNIYGLDEASHQYVFLARDTQAPYIDSRPLADPAKPEVRRYKAVYVLADEETGQSSDEVAVTCSP